MVPDPIYGTQSSQAQTMRQRSGSSMAVTYHRSDCIATLTVTALPVNFALYRSRSREIF